MPIVQFHVVTDAYPEEALTTLLREACYLYAQILYPDLSPPPVERTRAMICPVNPRWQATGGILVSDGGTPAPYFTCVALAGRDPDQLRRLMQEFARLVARRLGCDIMAVRGRLIAADPEHWFIGDQPASQTRAGEVAARRGA